MTGIIGFPNPVNEKAARTVAGGVLVLSALTLLLSLESDTWLWIVAPMAAGFIARVLTGPKLSPLGQLATKVVAPRLGEPKLVAGPPKRFAQLIGAIVTTSAVVFLAVGIPGATQSLLGAMIVAAGLESIFGYCLGCKIFGVLMRAGLIPEATCAACADISLRLPGRSEAHAA
ncbi:MAG: hypothetical protein QOG80_798 [Pseudonocardiales bacterium]|jgi:hypothetical protein|nr:hypothetical protein [Pseudonocardiales bacterium]